MNIISAQTKFNNVNIAIEKGEFTIAKNLIDEIIQKNPQIIIVLIQRKPG